MKRILTIQDLSCVGRCSLTVALPILSAMGVNCTALPTTVLSAHTGYENPHVRSLTEDIVPNCRHLAELGVEFDAILIGYLSGPEQVEAVAEIMELFPCPVILDPAMGDDGQLYNGLTQDHIYAMKDLAAMADVLLPNVTEACMLTGIPYQEKTDGQVLRMMLERLCGRKTHTVVITGVMPSPEQIGFVGVQAEEGMFSYHTQRNAKLLSGTGDMFSAVFSGAYIQGRDPMESAQLAADFVKRVMDHTPADTFLGAEFEPQLPWLWEQL